MSVLYIHNLEIASEIVRSTSPIVHHLFILEQNKNLPMLSRSSTVQLIARLAIEHLSDNALR